METLLHAIVEYVEDSVGLRRLVRFAAHIEEQTMCKARFVNAAQKLLQWEGCTR